MSTLRFNRRFIDWQLKQIKSKTNKQTNKQTNKKKPKTKTDNGVSVSGELFTKSTSCNVTVGRKEPNNCSQIRRRFRFNKLSILHYSSARISIPFHIPHNASRNPRHEFWFHIEVPQSRKRITKSNSCATY